jgi:hypothetical protein
MASRKPNKRSSNYLGQGRWWHGWVTIGIKDDGSPDRRHRKGADGGRGLRQSPRAGAQARPRIRAGAGWPVTVGQWMEPG